MQTDDETPARPEALHEGGAYLWYARAACRQASKWETVCLVGFTPCPAVVIVRLGTGATLPVSRDELYR